MSSKVRVRFPPSPTGPLSFGNARTALFNWLFAKANGGEFLLRIEDTDKERSKKEYEEDLLENLRWLGFLWDNSDFYRQSERGEIYEEYLRKLYEEKKLYWCFCTEDELEADRQAQIAEGLAPIYRGPCSGLDREEAESKVKTEQAVLRFRTPKIVVSIHDLIRGTIKYDCGLIGDIIIAKSFTEPLYNFAVVVDDYLMEITHVIRGEDHLSNTPKQWMIAEAVGFMHPQYAHLPLMLGPDKKKLSKRYLDGSLKYYREKGYLAEAVVNFLALIGWHPKKDREVLTVSEMVKEFSLSRVQKGGGVFNPDKLDWYNKEYIKQLSLPVLLERILSFIPEAWRSKRDMLQDILLYERTRITSLSDFVSTSGYFFELPEYEIELLRWKEMSLEDTLRELQDLLRMLEELPDELFSLADLKERILPYAESRGRGEVLWPFRVALSGHKNSLGPLEISSILGRHETTKRLRVAVQKLESKKD